MGPLTGDGTMFGEGGESRSAGRELKKKNPLPMIMHWSPIDKLTLLCVHSIILLVQILYSGIRMGVKVIEEMGDCSYGVLVGITCWDPRVND